MSAEIFSLAQRRAPPAMSFAEIAKAEVAATPDLTFAYWTLDIVLGHLSPEMRQKLTEAFDARDNKLAVTPRAPHEIAARFMAWRCQGIA